MGKNGTGKSNLFEALIEIFRHIVEYDRNKADLGFSYRVVYKIEGSETTKWSWGEIDDAALRNRPKDRGFWLLNGRKRKTVGKTQVLDKVLIYYSGHNKTVAGLVELFYLPRESLTS
ncbi:hypothetical protein [Nitrosococcus oceani]|uniref:hypothetical protein n=1 Tax=Nitrosococcus oceani TaxID=1229 RepID=UPI001E3C9FAB|nr:hypothetical protein [Nitrosococcus oceani]